MKCPNCKEELRPRMIGTVQVDECEKCNGAWFDTDELRKLKDETDSDLSWMDFELWKHQDRFRVSARPHQCPKCDANMASIAYDETGIEIDHCVGCKGVWLDGGEFQKIIDALTEELLSRSALEYIRASLEEAKELITGPESFVSEWRDFLTVMRMLQYRVLVENPKVNDALVELQKINPIR